MLFKNLYLPIDMQENMRRGPKFQNSFDALSKIEMTWSGHKIANCLHLRKGQLIQKCPFGVFISPKKPTKFLQGFLPYPLKRGQIKKGCFIPLTGWFYFDSLRLLFWFDLFLEARAKILTKISSVFLEDSKTPKVHFKVNWPSADHFGDCV